MGASSNKNNSPINQSYTGHREMDIDIINKVRNSICKIMIMDGQNIFYGTGYFMKISDSLRYLLTNHHNINSDVINKNIEIEICNKKKFKLDFTNRDIKYFKPPIDITIIEIKYTDEIYEDIEFLDYDNNYDKKDYNIYKNKDVFSIEHPLGKGAKCASGTIISINNYEFFHNISIEHGSSGSPIILLNDDINFIQVIGIHKSSHKKK